MKRHIQICCIGAVLALGFLSMAKAQKGDDDAILQCRDSVWRAWFSNDTKTLKELVPEEAIAISPSEDEWKGRADILRGAAEFQSQGGKLIRLEFPHTKLQRYGNTAFVYSQFILETEVGGKRSLGGGRATEIFVLRNGRWVNPGWHTDSHR